MLIHFWALSLLSVFRVDTLSLSGLPAGCSLREHPLWFWALLLLSVSVWTPFLSLDSLLVVLFGDILCGSGLYRCCLCSVWTRFLSLDSLLVVLFEDILRGSGLCGCWLCSAWTPFLSLDSLLVVLSGDILCDSGLYRCCLCSVIENKGIKTLNPFVFVSVFYIWCPVSKPLVLEPSEKHSS